MIAWELFITLFFAEVLHLPNKNMCIKKK